MTPLKEYEGFQYGPHLFASGRGNCVCRWCGFTQVVAKERAARRNEFGCKVTLGMRRALLLFARANGRLWKDKLHQEWEGEGAGIPADLQGDLRALRNITGPTWLLGFPTRVLELELAKGGAS